MSFHLDYLLDLPGVMVETCTQIEGKIYFRLSALESRIVCPHCDNYTGELHQNRPILARDLSVFGRYVYLQVPRRQFYCANCQRYVTAHIPQLRPGGLILFMNSQLSKILPPNFSGLSVTFFQITREFKKLA